MDAIITAYTARLRERTRHHLGCVQPVAAGISQCCLTHSYLTGCARSYPYNLDFDFGPLEGLLKCVELCAGWQPHAQR